MNLKATTTTLILGSIITFSSFAKISQNIQDALLQPERDPRSVARDAKRKPAEILSILDVKAGDTIVDLSSGSGYYTDILSSVVGDNGRIIAHNTPYLVSTFGDFFVDEKNGWPAKFKSDQWQKNVKKSVEELDTMKFPVQLDGALMVLFYHDTVWQAVDRRLMNQHLFNALKPGGGFVIVDHSAASGVKDRDVKSLHRIDKQFVIDEVTKAGFVLDIDSDLLENSEDTRDYNIFRDSMTDRDNTDRFILKFIKPAPGH